MDYNKFSYYRANPFANNDFIPERCMQNRKKKQFVSQIPQGQQYLPSKFGKRIFKDKVYSDQIQKDNILNSPQRYPFENRIALDKNFRRNLDTIDIQGASSGTKVSESIRNKHKALQELKRRNQQQIKSPLIGESLDQVYQKQRRQLAQQIHKNIQMRKTKENFSKNRQNQNQNQQSSNPNPQINKDYSKFMTQKQIQNQYGRYVAHNSNQKYNSIPPNAHEFEGFQRYKRVQKNYQTLDSYNNGRIPQNPRLPKENLYRNNSTSVDNYNNHYQNNNNETNLRRSSVDIHSPSPGYQNNQQQTNYMNNSIININNRHRSNPVYVQKYPSEMQKRIQQQQKNKQIEESIKNIYSTNRAQFRRNNPTNLSFNIAARSTLMSPII